MSKTNGSKKVDGGQGAAQKSAIWTAEKVAQTVKGDLERAIGFLQLIYSDPRLLAEVNRVAYERIQEVEEAMEEQAKQAEMFAPPKNVTDLFVGKQPQA